MAATREQDYSAQILEAVTAYAIDDPRRTSKDDTILTKLELNDATFCEKLYLERPHSPEVELAQYVAEGTQIVLVYGFPGTGKTSAIAKALEILGKAHPGRFVAIRIDFKALTLLDGDALERDTAAALANVLRVRAEQLLLAANVSRDEAVALLLQADPPVLHAHTLTDEAYNLFTEYKRDVPNGDYATGFHPWLRTRIAGRDRLTTEAIMRAGAALEVEDLLAAVPLARGGLRCVLVFDNVDSIHSDVIRQHFCAYVRKLHASIGTSARLIVAGRTANSLQADLSDHGSYALDMVEIEYHEFTPSEAYEQEVQKCLERQGFISEYDRDKILHRLEDAAKNRFATAMLALRYAYLDERVRMGIPLSFSQTTLSRLRQIYEIAVGYDRISGAALNLANHDRREMLMHMSNFVRFIAETVSPAGVELGASREEQQFVLESYFYHWVIDRHAIPGMDVYDIVGDWFQWQRDPKGHLGCSLHHLIVATIYNATKRIRGKHTSAPRTTIAQVLEALATLGYASDVVRQEILNMYKSQDSHFGILETERFYRVKSVEDLKPNDAIWLTPRTIYISDYLNLKLLFLLSKLRQHRYIYQKKLLAFEERNPITRVTLCACLHFLCHLASMHISGLAKIRPDKCPAGDEAWLNSFRRMFCVLAPDERHQGAGDLLLRNMLRSHIKFLRHQGGISPWEFIAELDFASWYLALAKAFDEDVVALARGDLNLAETTAIRYMERIDLRALEERIAGDEDGTA
jgi:ribosomal protein S8